MKSEAQFRSPRRGLIESADGYSVEVTQGFREQVTLRYREGDRVLDGRGEYRADKPDIMLWRSSTRSWQPPHHAEPLSQPDRDRIVARMRLALAWDGTDLGVVDDRPFEVAFDPTALAKKRG